MIDNIRGSIAYLTAAIATLGSAVIAYLAWASPIPEGGGRDIAILFGFLGLIAGGAVQFLFNAETRTQATKAAERTQEKTAASMSGPTPNDTGHPG